jgi:hypothetical protein
MADEPSLFSEQELAEAMTRVRKCRKCRRRLHADHQERFETRVAGLCYSCIRAFDRSPYWDVDTFIRGANGAVKAFMEEAEAFEDLLSTSREPVRIEERLVNRIGVREWGLPTLVIPGQIWRSETHGTITCMLPHPTEANSVSIETRSLEVIPVDDMSWMPDAWRAALWSYVQEWWTSGCHLGPFLAISDAERAKFLRKLCMKLADSDHIGALHVAHAIGQFAALDFQRPTANA